MLLECISMSAYSRNFNLSKFFRTFGFRVWIYHLKIYNFISVSQTQIGENPDNLNNVESYSLASNYLLQCEAGWTRFFLLRKKNQINPGFFYFFLSLNEMFWTVFNL